MILPHNWKATFIDAHQRIVLTKPGQNHLRRIHLKFEGLLRRTDKHGNPSNDMINPLAPETRTELLAACRERWDNVEQAK